MTTGLRAILVHFLVGFLLILCALAATAAAGFNPNTFDPRHVNWSATAWTLVAALLGGLVNAAKQYLLPDLEDYLTLRLRYAGLAASNPYNKPGSNLVGNGPLLKYPSTSEGRAAQATPPPESQPVSPSST